MAASTEYSLKYSFDIPQGPEDLQKLKPGDIVSSSCPPTETLHKGRSVVYSPAGFPLHFSLQLVYEQHNRDCEGHNHTFELQLRLEEPSGVPFLPPLHIQPTNVPVDSLSLRRVTSLHPRHVGPQQPGVWGLQLFGIHCSFIANRSFIKSQAMLIAGIPRLLFPTAGEFRFRLLSEPRDLLAALPAPSNTDWSILPVEMMSAVLRELPLADRVSARLVCHAWKRILDTDSQAWTTVSHLQSIRKKAYREHPYGYHEGLLNQVREDKLYEALGFLASRKAPIHCLELNASSSQDLDHLPSELSKRRIKLKALLFQSKRDRDDSHANEDGAILMKLIESQPSLERLYIDKFNFVYNATPSLNLAFARLRILSLGSVELVQACLPHLANIDGLRLALWYPGPEQDYTAQLAGLSKLVESQGPGLRRAQNTSEYEYDEDQDEDILLPCGCHGFNEPGQVLVWGTGNLSPSTAAFLVMPPHAYGFHHHL